MRKKGIIISQRGDYMGMIKDIQTLKLKDPAARHTIDIVLTHNGLHAVWNYRIAHFFWVIKLKLLSRFISNFGRFTTGVDIHPAAQIGERFIIDHGTGIVIGETAVIGNNVLIYHGVTLGGTGNDSEHKRHPTVCDNVMIAAGAKILGNIRVGLGARVGANSVVLIDVPPYATAVGLPARIIEGQKISNQECSLMSKERK